MVSTSISNYARNWSSVPNIARDLSVGETDTFLTALMAWVVLGMAQHRGRSGPTITSRQRGRRAPVCAPALKALSDDITEITESEGGRQAAPKLFSCFTSHASS